MGDDNFDVFYAGFGIERFGFRGVVYQVHVDSVSEIFHRFAKYGIVHQFIKVAFKVRRCLSSLFGIKINVGFDPRVLGKFESALRVRHSHFQTSIKFQFDVVGDVFCFVVQIGYEFFGQDMLAWKRLGVRGKHVSRYRDFFGSEGVVVMEFV